MEKIIIKNCGRRKLSGIIFLKPIFCLILLCGLTKSTFAQQKILQITKKNGSYHKSIKLPVNMRIVTNNDNDLIMRVDSITNGYIYSNSGIDSFAIKNVNRVHLRGIKEILKYTGVITCAVITVVALWFTNEAIHDRVAKDVNNDVFILPGLIYAGTFATMGTLIYLYPKTRFPVQKYDFHVQ